MARDRRSPNSENQSRPKNRKGASSDSVTLDDQCHPRKIFIGGLAHKTKTHHLREHFQKYGNIVDAVVLQWPDGRSRGFGYVTFAEANAALSALEVEHQVGGRQVDVKRAVPGTNKLFVGGLPQNASVAELRAHFEAFGVVSDAVVMMDPTTNRSRGFGFVCFLPGQEGATAVAAALEQYSNHRIRGKWIEVKSAAPPHKLAGAEGADAEPSPESSPAARPRADASQRKPLAAVQQTATQGLEPQKISLPGMAQAQALPPPPPGLHTGAPAAGARMPPPGLLSMPAPKGPPRHVPWPPATMGFTPYAAGSVPPPGYHHAPETTPVLDPVKVSDASWTSASLNLQNSLAQLLAASCPKAEETQNFMRGVAVKALQSPEKVRPSSYFLREEMEIGSPMKAER